MDFFWRFTSKFSSVTLRKEVAKFFIILFFVQGVEQSCNIKILVW
jgi:hypothetical protein